MKISRLANKFAMKLGLESRPAPSSSLTEHFNYNDSFDDDSLDLEPEEVSKEFGFSGFDPNSEPKLHVGKHSQAFTFLLNDLKAKSFKLSESVSLRDYSTGLAVLDELRDTLDGFEHYMLRELPDEQTKSASTYMYESEEYDETDSDRDFETFWNYYIEDLDAMTIDELEKEKDKLNQEAVSHLASEDDVSKITMQKLKEVRKRLKLDVGEVGAMADIMDRAKSSFNLVE
jgi:hypothetical protein